MERRRLPDGSGIGTPKVKVLTLTALRRESIMKITAAGVDLAKNENLRVKVRSLGTEIRFH
jgi:hypothetical protein